MRRTAAAFVLALSLPEFAFAGGWTPLTNQPNATASTMFLLTDGRVLLHDESTIHWWLLTPDSSGSYLNGTWSAAADANYDRLYYASAVFADGRVIVSGGEYSNLGGSETTKTEIYDPIANTWTEIAAPSGWKFVGDAPSTLLVDGTFLLGSIADAKTAILDPATLTWSAGPNKLNTSSTEESWALLPDGSVVTADCRDHPGSQRYVPSLAAWVDCGNTPVDLVESSSLEIGPAILMNDARCFYMGATPHCALYSAPANPPDAGTWVQGGDPPQVSGKNVGAKDAPAAILPGGHVLCALGPVTGKSGDFLAPTYFFEFDGANFTRVSDPSNNGGPPFVGHLLLLPTGEVLFAAGTIELYTPDGTPDPSWKPTIAAVPTDLLAGRGYLLAGTQLNGLTQAVGYGDEAGTATNYPLVRLTNHASGHVAYCRTHDHSTMAVATGNATVTTHFEVPAGSELGGATLEVVVNGIVSDPVDVVVRAPVTIDFDSLAAGVAVTTQLPPASFSSSPGFENWTTAAAAGSPPNSIATGPSSGGTDGLEETDVDFACPVVDLTFRALGVDGTGTVATVNVYEDGVLSGSVAVVGNGDPATPVVVDCTGFTRVTRIEISANSDPGGIAWDDFDFGLAESAAWANYGAGFPGTSGVPAFTAESDPVLGAALTLDLGNSLGATTPALVLIGLSRSSVLTGKGGTILVAPSLLLPLSLPPAGTTLTGTLANDPALCGLEVDLQALEADNGATRGFSFTAGLALTLGF